MVRTQVGYTGGTSARPTYRDLHDHAEAIEVVFDPQMISYEELLKHFWESHDPSRRVVTGQYRVALFVHSADQRRRAQASSDAAQRVHGDEMLTPIIDAGPFHPAEDYHQKWMLRNSGGRWFKWIQAAHPDPEDFRSSTAAARLNGWFAGHGKGTAETLAADLGLTSDEANALAERLGWPQSSKWNWSGLPDLFGDAP